MIYTREQWARDNSFGAAPGQEIDPEIYEDMFEVLPPLRLPRGAEFPVQVAAGFMVSEPYTHAEVNGRWKAFYSAFGRNGDKCYYLGYYSAAGDKLPKNRKGY